MFNNVIPFDRAGRGIGQGPTLQEKLKVCPNNKFLEFPDIQWIDRIISSTSTSSFRWRLKHTALWKKTLVALFSTLVRPLIRPSYQIAHRNSADALFTHMMDNFKELGFMSSNVFCDAYAEIHTCEAASTVGPSCLGPISACTFPRRCGAFQFIDCFHFRYLEERSSSLVGCRRIMGQRIV